MLCGNFDCITRTEIGDDDGQIGLFFSVDESELPDGEVWFCDRCSSRHIEAAS